MSGHADTLRRYILGPERIRMLTPHEQHAMDALDALVAENQRLTHERDFLQRELGFKNTLRQENQRLRDALQAVIDKLGDAYVSRIVDAYEIARAAWAGTPSEKPNEADIARGHELAEKHGWAPLDGTPSEDR